MKRLFHIALLCACALLGFVSNAEAQAFAEMLKIRNIPYELKEGKDIFTIPAVNMLYFYAQFLINPEMYSHRIFELLVSKPFDIHPKDYQVLYAEVSKGKTFIEVLRNIDKSKFIEPEKFEKFLNTYDYLSEYKTKEKSAPLTKFSSLGIEKILIMCYTSHTYKER